MTSHDRYWQSLAFHTSGLLGSSALPSETVTFGLYISSAEFSDFLFCGCLIKAVILKQWPDFRILTDCIQWEMHKNILDLFFFPFTNNLLFSLCEMLSQEAWHKGLAQVVIDILEMYLILKQSDLCSGVGVCPSHIELWKELGRDWGTFTCVMGLAVCILSQCYIGKCPSPIITPIYLLLDSGTLSTPGKKTASIKIWVLHLGSIPSKSSFCLQQMAWFFCRWKVARMKQTSRREEHLAGMLKWLPSAELSIT